MGKWLMVLISVVLTLLMGSLFGGDISAGGEKPCEVSILAGGELSEIDLEDLEDGETKVIEEDGKKISMTRNGDQIKIEIQEEDEEGRELTKMIVMDQAPEEGSMMVFVNEDGETTACRKEVKVWVDAEEGEEGKCKIKVVRLGEGDETEIEKMIVIGGGEIVIDGETLDLAGLGLGEEVAAQVTKALEGLDLEGLGSEGGEHRVIMIRGDGEDMDLTGLEGLEGLEGLPAHCKILKMDEDVSAYKCPECGTQIRIPTEEDTRTKYKCPVCKTRLEKAEEEKIEIRKVLYHIDEDGEDDEEM